MNEFTTIFEYTAGSIRADALVHFATSMLLVIGGILGFIFHKRILAEEEMPAKKGIFGIMILIGLAWALVHLNLFSLAGSDINGNCRMAEGMVQVSHRQPYHGHSSGDKITVGGQPFEVDYFFATPGYNRTIAHGGALCAGVYARLHHVNGVILKVEVRKK